MMRPSPATPSYGTTSSWNIAIGMGRGNFGYGFESIHSSPRYPEPGPRHLTRCPLRQYSDLASFLPVFHHFLCSHLTSPKPLLQTSLINLLTIERSLTSKKKKISTFSCLLAALVEENFRSGVFILQAVWLSISFQVFNTTDLKDYVVLLRVQTFCRWPGSGINVTVDSSTLPHLRSLISLDLRNLPAPSNLLPVREWNGLARLPIYARIL